jgi:uncharacterized membrane protein YdjX (TVP38/TMEM64 family)
MKRALPGLAVAAVLGLFVAGLFVRQHIDVDIDLSLAGLERLREWVASFGWMGSAVFFLLVVFRNFLFLPSGLILALGGLAFGVAGGTLLGGAGLVVAGGIQFALARVLGDEWVRPRLGERGKELEAHVARAGPWVVGIAAGHPAGPMTPVNLAAGLSSLPAAAFALAVTIGGPIRAGTYSAVGSSLLELGLVPTLLLGVALFGIALLPLLHPRVRAWIAETPRL